LSGSNASTEVIIAKIHAMYGKRLTASNYRDLVNKQSVAEIAGYLKTNTWYAETLTDINENSIHRGQLEDILKKLLFLNYTKLLRYINGNQFEFYSYILKLNEIEQILICVRLLNAGKVGEYIFSLPIFFADNASFDLFKLAQVKNFTSLIDLLSDTDYYTILNKHIPNEDNLIDLTALEVSLRTYYFSCIFKSINKIYNGIDKKDLTNSFETEIDFANLINIIRLKTNFDISIDEIRLSVLPFRNKLSKGQLEQIIKTNTADEALNLIKQTYYGKIFNNFSFEYLEQYSQQYRYDYYKYSFRFSQSQPAKVVAFLNLSQIELKNIISIIEGIRYKIPSSEINKLLVGVE
jgi:V/A-type H+-transporting ATPase subunit C